MSGLKAQNVIHLTLERTIDLYLENSYSMENQEMNIQQSILSWRSQQAALKTSVSANVSIPDFSNTLDYQYNWDTGKNELVRENTTRWQSNLSIRQPIILFGMPTDGYLSLNNRLYQYIQKDGGVDVSNYNRWYVSYDQPLFQPNELKNDLVRAEISLENILMNYTSSRVSLINAAASAYYGFGGGGGSMDFDRGGSIRISFGGSGLFSTTYNNMINQNQLDILARIGEIADSLAQRNSARASDRAQVQLTIGNIQESVMSNRSSLRQATTSLKQSLRLNPADSLYVTPTIELNPIDVDIEEAVQLALDNSVSLKRMYNSQRTSLISFEEMKARGAFNMSLEFTYGLEKRADQFNDLSAMNPFGHEYDLSNSVSLNAYIPIWDSGVRRNRIQAEEIELRQDEIDIAYQIEEIENDIRNTCTNVIEYYNRAVNMQNSVEVSKELTQVNIEKYANNEITLQDLLQTVARQKETEELFLDIYLDYKRELFGLMTSTYWDYENDMSLFDEFELEYEY